MKFILTFVIFVVTVIGINSEPPVKFMQPPHISSSSQGSNSGEYSYSSISSSNYGTRVKRGTYGSEFEDDNSPESSSSASSPDESSSASSTNYGVQVVKGGFGSNGWSSPSSSSYGNPSTSYGSGWSSDSGWQTVKHVIPTKTIVKVIYKRPKFNIPLPKLKYIRPRINFKPLRIQVHRPQLYVAGPSVKLVWPKNRGWVKW